MRRFVSLMRGLERLVGRRNAFDDRGQSAFEFLLILPFFILFMLLLIDFGVVMYGYVSVSNAAREGARFASVSCAAGGCSASDIQNRTVERSSGFLSDASEVTLSIEGTDRGDSIAVTAVREHDFLFFPASYDIGSCAAMRFEQDDGGSLSGGGTGSCSP